MNLIIKENGIIHSDGSGKELFCSLSDDCSQYNTENKKIICGKMISNPYNNMMNFDTIGYSVIMVF